MFVFSLCRFAISEARFGWFDSGWRFHFWGVDHLRGVQNVWYEGPAESTWHREP
jgi:hypothetical protein